MLRKTLTILSLFGLLLSVGLWGVSYFDFVAVACPRGPMLQLDRGGFAVTWRQSPYWFGVESGCTFIGFRSLDTRWLPELHRTSDVGYLQLPFWIPALAFASMLMLCRPLYFHRRRKRKKLGLCLKCGYNLTGLTEPRCPECNTQFDEQLMKNNA